MCTVSPHKSTSKRPHTTLKFPEYKFFQTLGGEHNQLKGNKMRWSHIWLAQYNGKLFTCRGSIDIKTIKRATIRLLTKSLSGATGKGYSLLAIRFHFTLLRQTSIISQFADNILRKINAVHFSKFVPIFWLNSFFHCFARADNIIS